ncbi:MAG: hypothetical protein P8Y63_11870 [Deltaproteobacteria bacterium]
MPNPFEEPLVVLFIAIWIFLDFSESLGHPPFNFFNNLFSSYRIKMPAHADFSINSLSIMKIDALETAALSKAPVTVFILEKTVVFLWEGLS